MNARRRLLVTTVSAALLGTIAFSGAPSVSQAVERIAYGPHEDQFADLRLPAGAGPYPVAVVIHGGCWSLPYDLEPISELSAALTRAGFATWTIEYRRLGQDGGGWPGTLLDSGAAVDRLRELSASARLDLDRIVLIGHSAGGQLALLTAARPRLAPDHPLRGPNPLPVRGVVSLSGITDLREYALRPGGCNAAAARLAGGSPAEVPERYALASPVELLPLGVPVRLVHGRLDPIVPVEQSLGFEARARAAGDDARAVLVDGAGHFEPIAPTGPAYEAVERAVRELASRP